MQVRTTLAQGANLPSLWARGLLIAIALLGLALRSAAVGWNAELLHGDVNLHALAAREYAEHGRLHYPMKFDYREGSDPEAMTTPAVLHPRGVPFVAGRISRWSGVDAYAVLQGLSFVFGAALLALGFALAWRHASAASVAGFACLAACPLLVDFSGNGSPYAGVAFAISLASLWLAFGPHERAWHGVLYGVLAGLSAELHGTMVALVLAYLVFWFTHRRELRFVDLAGFLFAYAITRLPSYAWTWSALDSSVYPLSEWLLTYRFRLAEPWIVDGNVVMQTRGWSEVSWIRYASEVVRSAIALAVGTAVEAGPLLGLMALGLPALGQSARLRSAALPALAFLAVILVWGWHEQRYLAALAPAAVGLGAVGLAHTSAARWVRAVTWIGVFATLLWFAAAFAKQPRSRYSAGERHFVAVYPDVRELGRRLSEEPPGVVLGLDRSALGGLYWHGLPLVDGSYEGPPWVQSKLQQHLVRQYDVRYAWIHAARADSVYGDKQNRFTSWLPVGREVARVGEFAVFEIERESR